MRFKSARKAVLLTLVVLISVGFLGNFTILPVHAVSFVNTQKLLGQSGPCSCALPAISITAGNGLIVVVDNSRQSGSTGPTIADSLTSSWNTAYSVVSNGNIKETVFWAIPSASGSDTVTITIGGGASGPIEIVEFQYSTFTGVGSTATNVTPPGSGTGTDTQSLSIAANSVVLETGSILNSIVNTCGSISLADTNRYNNCDTSAAVGYGQQINEHGPFAVAGTISETMTYSGWNTPGGFVHGLIELQGTASPTSSTVTQCYGNCGSPAITLANTNSTHTINFNQTITLFYEFQSGLNGFILNVTTSLAKNYGTTFNGVTLGIYTIGSCPQGQIPFSSFCPGLLQQQASFSSPAKGKVSTPSKIPVGNGQWVGISLSGTLSGLDINDTNTAVNLFQTNDGRTPTSIQNSASIGNNKMGLWAFITGNVITGIPPPTTNVACAGIIDCVIPNIVNGSCSVITTACQTGASVFWIIILTILSIGVLVYFFGQVAPSINLGRVGLGEMSVLIFIMWIVVFNAANVLTSFVIVLTIFAVSWLFMGKLKGTGPI